MKVYPFTLRRETSISAGVASLINNDTQTMQVDLCTLGVNINNGAINQDVFK